MRMVKNGQRKSGGANPELCFVRDICGKFRYGQGGKFRYGYLEGGLAIRGGIEAKNINLGVINL